MPRLDFNCSGISFRVGENPELAHARPEGKVTVRLDPDNKYAKHPRGAFPVTWNGMEVGFVPDAERETQDKIVEVLDSGKVPDIEVMSYSYATGKGKAKSFNEEHQGELGSIRLSFVCEDEAPAVSAGSDEPVMLESFNEPGVELAFFPDTHTYFHDGVKLESVTRLVSAMYEPFNARVIAGRCEKSYGMKTADIMAMWKSNGKVASDFGNAVHAAIENYEKYGKRSLPKMPILREIVETFPFVGAKVHAEVLITSVKRGICGLCDRLLEIPAGLLVCDIKVNVEAEKEKPSLKNKTYPGMAKNKITKYNCQTSIYAAMLAESGLNVNNEVAFHVWTGTWTNYRNNRIKDVLDVV